jgi:hypothetical protein
VDEIFKQALAAPVQPVAWHDKIKGMEVSMDVSTGDDDIDHRVYGQVYEVMLAYDGGPDVILAIESERNYTTPPAAQQEPVEFEDWHSANYVQPLEKYGDSYKNMHVRNRWQGWLGAKSTPPAAQRQWVGLTDEAKLKEKNT